MARSTGAALAVLGCLTSGVFAAPAQQQDPGPVPSATAEVPCGESCGEDAPTVLDAGLFELIFDGDRLFDEGGNSETRIKHSVGAKLRHRYMDERNRLRPGGPAASQYQLWRFTPFVDLSWDDTVSVHFEAIDASAFGYDPPLFPLGTDVNRSDILQAWVDVRLAKIGDDGQLRYRYGRQVLKYGTEHVLSPLGWSNTFRNFEGHKLMLQHGDWQIDGLWLHSVDAAAGGSNTGFRSFDRPDYDRFIAGIYSTYSGLTDNTVDLYWLYSEDRNDNPNRMDGERHTFGARLAGGHAVKEAEEKVGLWNWDVEAALQTGTDDFQGGTNLDVFAGFLSATGGYTASALPWSPRVDGIFYYGSGDDDPNDNKLNTVYTLYPLGHAYWGLIDNFSGQNLIDLGARLTVSPHEKCKVAVTWHDFSLAQSSDNLYNIAGAPFALAGSDAGSELDVISTWQLSEEFQVQVGHSWFFYGSGVTNSAFARDDARQFYVQSSLTF